MFFSTFFRCTAQLFNDISKKGQHDFQNRHNQKKGIDKSNKYINGTVKTHNTKKRINTRHAKIRGSNKSNKYIYGTYEDKSH